MQKYKIYVCRKRSCSESFSKDTKENFEKLIRQHGLEDTIVLEEGGCYGRCKIGPNVVILGPVSEEKWELVKNAKEQLENLACPSQIYNGVYPDEVRTLFESHCLNGKVLTKLAEQVDRS